MVVLLAALVSTGVPQAIHSLHAAGYSGIAPTCRVATTSRVVALSFDDGPDEQFTTAVLGLLTRYRAKATFFVVGDRAKRFPLLGDRLIAGGMEIGDHTWSHPRLPGLTAGEAESQIARTQDLLHGDGVAANLFRAPFGEISPSQIRLAEHMGLRVIHWSVALDHYVGGMGLAPAAAATLLAQHIRGGDLILAHDVPTDSSQVARERQRALELLALLLPALEARGFAVVTVSELLSSGKPVPAKPRVWFWQTGFSCPRG